MIPITDQAAYLKAPGGGKAVATAKQTADKPGFQLFGKDGFTFGDFIDIINPLQHIPIVSTIYRQITNDGLDPGSRIGGGALFGGPIGLAASLVNVLDVEATGKDIGEQVMALFDGGALSRTADAPTQTAESAVPARKPIWINPDAVPANAIARAKTPAWINPDTAAPASFATAGGDEVSKITENASPVREDINVLAWARRETAFRQRAQATEAAIEDTKIARRVTAMQTSGTQIAALAGSIEPSPGSRQEAVTGAKAPPRQAGIATPPGATAPLGGWFSDVMLSALTKYQAAAALKGGGRPDAGQAQKPD